MVTSSDFLTRILLSYFLKIPFRLSRGAHLMDKLEESTSTVRYPGLDRLIFHYCVYRFDGRAELVEMLWPAISDVYRTGQGGQWELTGAVTNEEMDRSNRLTRALRIHQI